MLNADSIFSGVHVASLVAAEKRICTMLNADSVVFDLLAASVAAAIPLRTMLNADSIVLDLLVASLMAAEEHLHTMLNADSVVLTCLPHLLWRQRSTFVPC